MNKTTISIFFTCLFMLFITAPLVINVIDKSIDISIFYSINEEENSQNEVSKKLDVNLFTNNPNLDVLLESTKRNRYNYYRENYKTLALDNFYPPPELI
ncbi:hypothetical protein [Xanthomarina sp. GH4-25]|uniref:hypothetical protein n=1 Tax=Xanthomarina sp. GH4-25 TaxID=3349335 RepID=UPI000D676EAB|nr:hypothetical protein DI383_03720 [Flavobacteriaceae bacterium LYZ1037]